MSRRRLMQNQGRGGELPTGYKRLKYLESARKQFIDVGVARTIDEYNLLTHFFAIYHVCWTNPDAGVRQLMGDGNGFWFGISAKNLQENLPSGTNTPSGWGTYTIDGVKNNLTLSYNSDDNEVSLSYSYSGGAANKNINIFAIENAPVWYGCYAKVDKFRIYRNEEIIRDMVSALRISDDKPGMWDFVTESFFTNAPMDMLGNSTGEFGYELLDGTYVPPV